MRDRLIDGGLLRMRLIARIQRSCGERWLKLIVGKGRVLVREDFVPGLVSARWVAF